jgi:hypothetical protein
MLHSGNYSILFLGGALWLIVAAVLFRIPQLPLALRLGGAVVAALALIGIWLLIRPTDNYTDDTDIERVVGNGKPTVLYFYSEY